MTLKEKYDLIIAERNKLVALERKLKTCTIVDTMYPSAVVMDKKEFEELADCLGVDMVATVPFNDEYAEHNQMTYFMYRGIKFMHFFKGVEA